MNVSGELQVVGGIARFRPRGECSLVEAVDLVTRAIADCRDLGMKKLLINATELFGFPIPTLVDRFLMAEMWADEAKGVLAMVMVVGPEYIHPKKFGVMVAADFGLVADVYSSETDAFEWLSSGIPPDQFKHSTK